MTVATHTQTTTKVEDNTGGFPSDAATSLVTLPLLETSTSMEGNGQTAQSSLDQHKSFEEPETSLTIAAAGESSYNDATHRSVVDGVQGTPLQTSEVVSPIVLLPSNIHPGRKIRSNRRIRHSGNSTTSVPENYKSAYIEKDHDTIIVATTVTIPSPTAALTLQSGPAPLNLSAGSSLSNDSTRKLPVQHSPSNTYSSNEHGAPVSVAGLLESINSIMAMSQKEIEEVLQKEFDELVPPAPLTYRLLSAPPMSSSIRANEKESSQGAGRLSSLVDAPSGSQDTNANTSQLDSIVPEPHEEALTNDSLALSGTRNSEDGIETSAVCEAAPVQPSGPTLGASSSTVADDNSILGDISTTALVHGIETESKSSGTRLSEDGSPPPSLPTEEIATVVKRECRVTESESVSNLESKLEWDVVAPYQDGPVASSVAPIATSLVNTDVGHTVNQKMETVAEHIEPPTLAPILVQDSVSPASLRHASVEVDISSGPSADPSQTVRTTFKSENCPVKVPESFELISEEQQVNDRGFSPDPLSLILDEPLNDASAQLPPSQSPPPILQLKTIVLSDGDAQTNFHSVALGMRDSPSPSESSSNEPSPIQEASSNLSPKCSPKNESLPSTGSKKDLKDGEIPLLSIGDNQNTVKASMSMFNVPPLTTPLKEQPTKSRRKFAEVTDLDLDDLSSRFGRFSVSDAGTSKNRRRYATQDGQSHSMFGNLRYSAVPEDRYQPVPIPIQLIPEVVSTTQAQADSDVPEPVQPTRSEDDKHPEPISVHPPLSETEKQSPAPQDTSHSNAAPVAEDQPNEEAKNSLSEKDVQNTCSSSLFALSAEGRRAGRRKPDRATRYHLSMIREAQTAIERMGSVRKVSIALKEDLETQRRPPVLEKVKLRIGCSSKVGGKLLPTGVPRTNPFAPTPSATKPVAIQERKSAKAAKPTTIPPRRTHASTPRESIAPSARVFRHPDEPQQPPPVPVTPVVVCEAIVNEDINDCHIPGAYPTVMESLETSSHVFPSFFNRIGRFVQHI
uniref:Uncharacterized protein n=1 Tax=Psilocybe cubensis TaxID=181762 RepID=A0A8H7XYY9_PSICU